MDKGLRWTHSAGLHGFAAALSFWAFYATSVQAQDAGAFFAGKSIRIIVGTGAGGGYDTYARLVARHFGKHLSGKPSIVVENMPGASGIRAVNYLYAAAPSDGTVISTFNNAMPVYQATGQAGIQFKTEQLSWIGSLTQTASVVVVATSTGVKTIDDARRIEVVMGATGAAGTKAAYAALLNNTLGTKFKIVTGYEGSNAVSLAMERGEVQGDASNPWSTWKSARADWVRNNRIVPIVQIGLKADPDLPQVPLLGTFAASDEQRQMFEFTGAPVAIQQPFAGPPKIPADRLEAMRKAFDAMTADPEFRAEAAKASMDLDPLSGSAVEAIVRKTVETPAAVIAKVQAAMTVKDAAVAPGSTGKGNAE